MHKALTPLLLAAALVLALPRLPSLRPSDEDRARELVERTIASQHRDDEELYRYERVERRISYEDSSPSAETYRLVPTGTGRLSLLLARGGRHVSTAEYRNGLREWERVLIHAVDPSDPREIRSRAQQRQKDQDRAELIDAIGSAFHFTWLDEETEGGRTLARIALDPNPAFQPTSRKTEIFKHVRATVWIDVREAQLVRGQATIISDVSVGAGIVSKIYKGGWFRIEQAEVSPGVWFPTRIEYSIRGRMLFFSMDEHKLTETSHYRYVGTPLQALEEVRRELAGRENSSFLR